MIMVLGAWTVLSASGAELHLGIGDLVAKVPKGWVMLYDGDDYVLMQTEGNAYVRYRIVPGDKKQGLEWVRTVCPDTLIEKRTSGTYGTKRGETYTLRRADHLLDGLMLLEVFFQDIRHCGRDSKRLLVLGYWRNSKTRKELESFFQSIGTRPGQGQAQSAAVLFAHARLKSQPRGGGLAGPVETAVVTLLSSLGRTGDFQLFSESAIKSLQGKIKGEFLAGIKSRLKTLYSLALANVVLRLKIKQYEDVLKSMQRSMVAKISSPRKREACDRCHGKGYYVSNEQKWMCKDCDGTGLKPVKYKWIRCPRCHGSGYRGFSTNTRARCSTCKGTGKVKKKYGSKTRRIKRPILSGVVKGLERGLAKIKTESLQSASQLQALLTAIEKKQDCPDAAAFLRHPLMAGFVARSQGRMTAQTANQPSAAVAAGLPADLKIERLTKNITRYGLRQIFFKLNKNLDDKALLKLARERSLLLIQDGLSPNPDATFALSFYMPGRVVMVNWKGVSFSIGQKSE